MIILMNFTDTHCHIHEILGPAAGEASVAQKWHKAGITNPATVIRSAFEADVTRMVCIGCTVEDSELAVKLAQQHEGLWSSIGIHPHEAGRYDKDEMAWKHFESLATQGKVVAVGECGLDFYYNHSPHAAQERALRRQIELAIRHDLAMVFHVRDAFKEFWPIFDEYKGIRGVIHSFSSHPGDVEQILSRGLYVGLNGIMTFSKSDEQLLAAKAVPLDRLVLETDAPYLTPNPYRGTICEPKHVRVTAGFLAALRGEALEQLAKATTANAQDLFRLR